MRGSLCRVWYAWIGVCVGDVAVYVLWVILIKVEVNSGECFTCELGDGCVECGEDACSVEYGEGFFVGYKINVEFGVTGRRCGAAGWVEWD